MFRNLSDQEHSTFFADRFTQLQLLELPSPDQLTQQRQKLLDLVLCHPYTILAKHIFESRSSHADVEKISGGLRMELSKIIIRACCPLVALDRTWHQSKAALQHKMTVLNSAIEGASSDSNRFDAV